MSETNEKDVCGPLAAKDFHTEPSLPEGADRRAFLTRSVLASAIALLTGRAVPASAQTPAGPPVPANGTYLSPNLAVSKAQKGPVMTTVEEMYKVGPGPSSSHTIGPMRITYDFYQRCSQLPAAQLDQATALKVHLYGSLSATGKGHGTERAALALIAKEMNSKYKETSEGGLAVSVVLC